VAPASTTTKSDNLLNPLPAKIAVLANTPTKPDVPRNVQKYALLASTQIVPVCLRTVNAHFAPPGNRPVNLVSPPTNRVFFARPENSPLKPVGRRTTNAKDSAQVVHIPAFLELRQVTSAKIALLEDGPMPPAALHKTSARTVSSENIRLKQG
jgi:hypothetical protein